MTVIIKLLAIPATLLSLTVGTPVQLVTRSQPVCEATWPYGKVGSGGPVTIVATQSNIDHLASAVLCKIPAHTTLRIACKSNSAIYVHNLENKETNYYCVNYVNNAVHIVNTCRHGQISFGPTWQDGAKWAMIIVGDLC